MPYLIDGHNLIPHVGLRLDSHDDEQELIALLQEFCRSDRRQVEVFFDGAPAQHAGTRRLGSVTAHFVKLGATADDAIRRRLRRLGKAARNWTVVSSDRQVQAEARSVQAQTLSSNAFSTLLRQVQSVDAKPASDEALPARSVEEWMKIFREGKKED